MILSHSASSVILLGLVQTLAQTSNVGAVPHDFDLPKLSNRASIGDLGNEAASVLQRAWKGVSCLSDCRPHWGWTGKHFGSDPWGPVVLTGDPIPYSDSETSTGGNNSSQSVGAGGYNTASNGGTGGVTTTVPTSTVVFSVYHVPTSSTTSTSSSSSSQEPTPTPTPQTTSDTPIQQATTSVDDQGQNQQTQSSSNNNNQSDSNSNSNSGGSAVNSNTSSGDSSVSADDQSQYLQQHNNFRAQHGANALTWSDQLAGFAQEWANNCQFQHSGGKFGAIGENLAAGTGDYGIPEMIGDWTAEITNYDPNNPQPSHFTQVVWKATTQVGCAKATCNGIFSGGGAATFYVCEYSPAGNVIGEFPQNVQK